MIKQILPNKLRVLVARRTGEEPDPPHVDFAGIGASNLDLLNIDIKIPSEHTVCGRRYDAEMQYYFFHPTKKSLLIVSWLFEATIDNPTNVHMQSLIDEFQDLYDEKKATCGSRRNLRVNTDDTRGSMIRGRRLKRDSIWNPFHADIQRTIHFWGYTGSLTEPPCSAGTMWRIMDVPVPITVDQLNQMQTILFYNRDSESCAYTSTHYRGSVARPTQAPELKYYKCNRDDYVSDEERVVCGDDGCVDQYYSTNLDPWIEPIIDVTGPPSESPTMVLDGPI